MNRERISRTCGILASLALLGCAGSAATKATAEQLRAQINEAQVKQYEARMRYRGCLESYVYDHVETGGVGSEIADGASVYCEKFADNYAAYSNDIKADSALLGRDNLVAEDSGRGLDEVKIERSSGADALVQEGRSESIALVIKIRSRGLKDQNIFRFPEK
jgi:hypothetical protein